MSLEVAVSGLTVRYGDTVALDGLSFRLDGGKICGLLGRNGSGKTTLLSVLAAFRRADRGEVTVAGADPYENPAVVPRICLVRDEPDVPHTTVRGVFAFVSMLRPDWDMAYAESLAGKFGLPTDKRVGGFSRGMKSALGIVLGLASRAPLTIFDESYLGLDAPSRYLFYDELLADYAERPRTILLSSHLIEEVGSLFEEVMILDRGRLLLHEEADALRSRGRAVTGPAEAVDRFTEGMTVLGEQRLGGTKSVAVYGELDQDRSAAARAAGLELAPVSLQDLFVHLTRQEER